MTIHRARLGPDLLQGARDDKPLTLLSIAISLVYELLLLSLLAYAFWDLVLALQTRTAGTWNDFWQAAHGMPQFMVVGVMGPLVLTMFDGMKLQERTARRYALLGDDHWAPALDVQPTPLTPNEYAQDTLDFGIVYAP